MKITPDTFFTKYRRHFGALTQGQVDGLNDLLHNLSLDDITDARQAAYMLATTKHETADTFHPIEEYGKGKGRRYGYPVNGHVYYGRGFVQLTWMRNYEAMGRVLHFDLVNHPEVALRPDVAYWIMSYGMRNGTFTGKKLADYIAGSKCDYVRARKIINGLDCCDKIAGYAQAFEDCLRP